MGDLVSYVINLFGLEFKEDMVKERYLLNI